MPEAATHEPAQYDLTPAAHPALAEHQLTSAEIRGKMQSLELELKEAVRLEQLARREQAARDQRQAQDAAKRHLAPLAARLERHVRELHQVDGQYSNTLRDYARTAAGDQDPDTRRKVSAIHGQAGPLRQRILEAVKADQAAIKSLAYAATVPRDSIIEDAVREADRALATTPADLANEAQALIDTRSKLRGVASTPRYTAFDDSRGPVATFSTPQPVRADYGGSILD